MKAIVLAGGRGTRLQSVINDIPKPMASVAGKPFLEYLILQLKSWDIRDIILSVGYRKDSIISYFSDGSKWGLNISYALEDRPLGTGGAIKNAEKELHENTFLAMNGDSYCPLDLNKFIEFHRERKALASIALAESSDTKDYGTITLDDTGRILQFQEKAAGKATTYINAGIYLFNKKVLSMIAPDSASSLEYDLFPILVRSQCYGFLTGKNLMDIGTPERFQSAQEYFSSWPSLA